MRIGSRSPRSSTGTCLRELSVVVHLPEEWSNGVHPPETVHPALPSVRGARPCLPETAIDLIAGAVGEAVQTLLLYPLDTIKVSNELSPCKPVHAATIWEVHHVNNLVQASATLLC